MHETPVSLLERLYRSPDESHWERFVALFTPILARWSHRLGVPAADTEDLLQEVFTLLFRKLPEFHYDPSKSFRAWLWTVFHHQTIAWRKRQTRELPLTVKQLEALESPDSVSEASEAEYRRALIARILQIIQKDFPPQTWQVFWELAVKGRPGVDVAKQFGLTANAVYLIRGRVLSRLRQELADLDR
jgi:RNA polymerase sigma-70 factor (ECF subfamily)